MPPNGYLSVTGIASAMQYLATTYSSICQIIPLPESSIEQRTIRAFKIANGEGSERQGILLIAGVHARELINPDLLVWFALKLCQAYKTNSGLTFGARFYDPSTIECLVNKLDIFFLPLVNPDGRAFVQSPSGYAMWRKNRNPNPSMLCRGVDLNRNYDFLWSSGIGTSSNSCRDIFKGQRAFSEPENLNVRYLLDTYANIGYFADVHSYSELILYPWGDDDNQTIDPTMNFQNPTYDGQRGTPGDSLYREYIPQSDLDWYVSTANQIRDAIAAVRGRTYTVQQGASLYPTTGTSEDYVYTRHFLDSSKGKVLGFILETGTEFQPPYSEALKVIEEVSAGLVEFCLACL